MARVSKQSDSEEAAHVPQGMPALDLGGRAYSFFEFWPSWLMYIPVAALWLLLALRYRSISLPLIASPAVPLSGMVGVPKSAILKLAGESADRSILPWVVFEAGGESPSVQRERAEAAMA
ncbi:MAG: D-alanine--D-alanine ligase, partial [Gammaproteobacteria bacterium]|nr:D-alanine--D-alanine ligase [Gammaproteobacteria bacterium]